MGIFDRNKKENDEPKNTQTKKHMITLSDKKSIFIFDINNEIKIQHSNREITKLTRARIIKHNTNGMIILENADYIAFELPEKQEVTDEILEAVMNQYDKDSENINYQASYYLGRLQENKDGYTFGNKSEKVQKIVSQMVNKEYKERQHQRKESIAENKRSEIAKTEKFRKSLDANSYINSMLQEKEERKSNPYIKEKISSERNGRKYYNYDGVNINTGDILEMRMVDKIGKDGSGTYLYSAFLNNSETMHEVQILGDRNPNGYAVCFELQKRLEDIVRDNNSEEINQLLSLLSDERNFESRDVLAYIGEIDKNGQINRRIQSSSQSINAEIIRIQKDFLKSIEQKEINR